MTHLLADLCWVDFDLGSSPGLLGQKIATRASTGPGTGTGTGPGRGFRKSSGLQVLTGPGLQYIYYIKRFCHAEIDPNNVRAILIDI